MRAERRGDPVGGVAAFAAAALPLGLAVATVSNQMQAVRDASPVAERVARLALATAPLLAAGAAAHLLAALSTSRLQRPPSWATRLGLAGALAGAALGVAAAVVLVRTAWTGRDAALGGALVEFVPVGVGVWALCVAAADWRLRLWPAWLRVAGTVFGGAAMVQPGFPPLGLVSLLTGLAWWIGLGVRLLRAPRSTGS